MRIYWTRGITGTVALGLVAFTAAGCGGGGRGSSTGTGSGEKSLTVATSENVKSLDPVLAYDTWSTAVVHAITRRLVDYDATGKLIPDLAERWETADGGKTYRFHLRTGLTFADGKPLDASSFQIALQRILSPSTASPGAGLYRTIDAVAVADPATLVVKLKAPDPTLLNLMAMTLAAPEEPGQPASQPASSGPYQLESYRANDRVVLKRNPRDTRSGPCVDRIVLQFQVNPSLQMTRFRTGEVDLLPAIPLADYQRVMADPAQKKNVVQGTVNQTWYFGMNVTRAPWNNPKVRQAALLAIDRSRHVQLAGAGEVANGILPPHVPGYDPQRKLPGPDVAGARKLLAEAGFPNGIPESQKCSLWLSDSDEYQRHAQAIQSDLRAVGIPVELRPVTFSQYITGYRTQADCWYGGWYPDFPDAGNFLEPVFTPGSSSNAAHYDNPRVTALLTKAHSMPAGEPRNAVYHQVEDQLLADAPWVPLYFEMETRYFREGVTGVTVHPVWRQMLTGINKR